METGRKNLNSALDFLSNVYQNSETEFLNIYRTLPYQILDLIRSAEFVEDKTDDQEYLAEIHYYYRNAVRHEYERDGKCLKTFTLRNFDDLQEMIYFLDKMIHLYKASPGHFMEIFPECPEAYWDKIDDLRETSYKYDRDSPDFIECLSKCKKTSFLFSEYMEYLSNNAEEWS